VITSAGHVTGGSDTYAGKLGCTWRAGVAFAGVDPAD
jgi:hypothetical protein